MVEIYTPGIFITTNYSLMKMFMFNDSASITNFFENPISYSLAADNGVTREEYNQVIKGDYLLINNKNNKYLQSFEYSIGYGEKKTPKLVLSFIDTDNNFENEFLNNGVVKGLMLSQLKNSVVSGKFFGNDAQKYLSFLRSQFKIYFSFGVGNDKKSWGGPFSAVLIKTEMDITSNGLRIYKFIFLPTNSFFFRASLQVDNSNPNQYEDLSFLFSNMRTIVTLPVVLDKNRFEAAMLLKSKLINSFTKSINPLANIPLPTNIDNQRIQNLDLLNLNVSYGLDDYHSNVSKLLKLYTSKVSGIPVENIIVILPKINEYCKNKFKEIKKEISGKPPPGLDVSAYNNEGNLSLVKKYVESLKSRQNITVQIPSNFTGDVKTTQGQKFIRDLAELYQSNFNIYSILYKLFGIDVIQSTGSGYNDTVKELAISGLTKRPKLFLDKALETQGTKKVEYVLSLETSTKEKEDKDKKVNIPDWWLTMQNLINGFAKVAEGFPASISAYQETDIRYLYLFAKYGLISDSTNPCCIIGQPQMIAEVLYANQTDYNRIILAQSQFQFESTDYVGPIVLDKAYRIDLAEIGFKHKNNSCFDEQLVLDELHFDSSVPQLQFNEAIQTAKLTDIPVFTNNITNSNVLSVSIDMSDNYTNATIHSVQDDRSRFLFKNIIQNSNEIFNSEIFSPEDRELIQKLYDKYIKIADSVISKQDLERLKSGDYTLSKYEGNSEVINSIFEKELNSAFDANRLPSAGSTGLNMQDIMEGKNATKLNPIDLEILERRKKASQNIIKKFDTIISAPDPGEIRWIQLALLNEFKGLKNQGKLSGIKEDALYSLVLFIIAMNKFNQKSSTAVVTPSPRGANAKSIQGQIFDYTFRFNTIANIRTLPFFYLSSWRNMRQPAILISKKLQPTRPPNADDINKSSIYDFFSGLYTIQGFKHIISSREMYSEFSLIKNVISSDDSDNVSTLFK